MLLCYVTDRTQLAPDESRRRGLLLERIAAAARAGVDYIQLREKDLTSRELETLARQAVRAVRDHSAATWLLVNARPDVALAAGADGVHLPATDISAPAARSIFASAGKRAAVVAVSCHSLEEVVRAEHAGADFALFGPVFEKAGRATDGLALLEKSCRRSAARSPAMPVLAIGGVTLQNAARCLAAGAAGIAAIRLFQEGNPGETVRQLREMTATQAAAEGGRTI
ncbi:MAG: thiamine phosphate synthase [Terriglobales bacterium]